MAFIDHLKPAPVGGGFSMEHYWVWCGSVIRGPEGRYHMFASRWPKALPFNPHWITNSQVVRATSPTPEGPYEFQEVVLPERDSSYWDGRMTHNPTIHKCGDTYLLFYTGTTYQEPYPTPGNPCPGDSELRHKARANQRIGLATAPSPLGPWTRRDEPILQPRPGKWDALITTNPAPCVLPDGRVLLIYKSVAFDKDLLRLGVAMAESCDKPFVRLLDEPILRFDATNDHVEDPYVWWAGDHFEMIMKDMRGGICGESHAGIHATSADGVHWAVSQPPKAYSRTVRWSDGSQTLQANLERPQLLIQDGKPTHLLHATGAGPRPWQFERTWCMVTPLDF